MRNSSKCTKCGSLKIGHLERLYDDIGDRRTSMNTAVLGYMGNTRVGQGILEAYVCTECGYVETYVKDPANVPFASIRGFRWVNDPDAQQGGYR